MTIIPALFVVLSSLPANGPRTTRSDLSPCPLRGGGSSYPRVAWSSRTGNKIRRNDYPDHQELVTLFFKVRIPTGLFLFCTREFQALKLSSTHLWLRWGKERHLDVGRQGQTLGGKSRNKVISGLDRGCLSHNWDCWFRWHGPVDWWGDLQRRSWLGITSIRRSYLSKIVIMMTGLILSVFRGSRVFMSAIDYKGTFCHLWHLGF